MLIVQLVGLILPFVLLLPITAPDFLDGATRVAAQVRIAVLLLFANGGLTIGISLAALPLLRNRSETAALGLVALSVIWFCIQAVDNAQILSMLSLSQRYTEGGASNLEVFATSGAALRSTRRWMHYTELLVIDTWFFVLYGLFFRFSLVPRVLAGLGVAMVVVHMAAITLPVFLDYRSIPALGPSLAVSHLAVAGWLLVTGVEERASAAG
jgi:hypothetical protein